MKNFVQMGDTINLVAPYAVSSGGGALVGSIFGVAVTDIANGAAGEFAIEGVFDLTALATDTFTGAANKAYWDDTNKRITSTATSNTLVGVVIAAKANGDATARVRLNSTSV